MLHDEVGDIIDRLVIDQLKDDAVVEFRMSLLTEFTKVLVIGTFVVLFRRYEDSRDRRLRPREHAIADRGRGAWYRPRHRDLWTAGVMLWEH